MKSAPDMRFTQRAEQRLATAANKALNAGDRARANQLIRLLDKARAKLYGPSERR